MTGRADADTRCANPIVNAAFALQAIDDVLKVVAELLRDVNESKIGAVRGREPVKRRAGCRVPIGAGSVA